MTAVLIFGATLSIPRVVAQPAAEEITRTLRRVEYQDIEGLVVGGYERSFALLVGVSQYSAGWPRLLSVPGELEEVAAVLEKHQFQIEKVLDPDEGQLRAAFRNFIARHGYDSENRLLFFFAGHGYTRHGGEKGYLVPADAPDPKRDEKGFLAKALTMEQIVTWAKTLEANHALFLFDSCFSGTIFQSRTPPETPPHITAYTSRAVRQFITAGSADETVPAQSIFVPILIRALEGEADVNRDFFVTGTELGMHVHEKVLTYQVGQTPQYDKLRDPRFDQGDFVFRLPRTMLPPETGSVADRYKAEEEKYREQQRVKAAWVEYLGKMEADFSQLERLELPASRMVQAWEDYLSNFAANDPYSKKDEELRTKARKLRDRWRQKTASVPPPPVVTTKPPPGVVSVTPAESDTRHSDNLLGLIYTRGDKAKREAAVREYITFQRKRGKRVELPQAPLAGLDLQRVNLIGAVLTGADLRKTDLRNANLSSTRLNDTRGLASANLHGAILTHSDLSGLRLDGANLKEADLRQANLSKTHLGGANLSRAKCHSTDLSSSKLLDQSQLDSVCGNQETSFPYDLRRPVYWKLFSDGCPPPSPTP